MSRRERIADELLVLGCQEGDTAAFACLVDRWQQRLWRHAWRLTGDEEGAEIVSVNPEPDCRFIASTGQPVLRYKADCGPNEHFVYTIHLAGSMALFLTETHFAKTT